jgi:enamine deaminase RidA (YjgF/YER057c/UK114 family)
MSVRRFGSGGPWEATVGYSRAVAVGTWLITAGCTATVDGQVVHVGDAEKQAREAFAIALDALARAGATAADVVRTRIYIVDRADAEAVGRVHGDVFGSVLPAATMVVVAGLMHPDHLVEVEMEAYAPWLAVA